jgi:hypothetical protein
MSTTFGVNCGGNLVEVAFRSAGNGIRVTNPELVSLLDDDTEVVPLDNSSQGIDTLRDVRIAIQEGRYR